MSESSVSGAELGLSGGAHVLLDAAEAQMWALCYVDSGWAVVAGPGLDVNGVCACKAKTRCRTPGKHAHPGWGNKTRFSMSRAQAEKYWSPDNKRWRDFPVDQIFIVPYLSGLAVADVDNQEAWESLPEQDRPYTLFQKSGSGRGGHYLYSYDWDRSWPLPPTLPGKLKKGAGEVKFRGIIAAHPSPHASGGRYEWANWGTAATPAPASLVSRETSVRYGDLTWDKLALASSSDDPGELDWITMLFRDDLTGYQSVAEVEVSRVPVVFAVAARMAKWVAVGRTTEEEVAQAMLEACSQNGVLADYGDIEIRRWVRNAIRAGMEGKRLEW